MWLHKSLAPNMRRLIQIVYEIVPDGVYLESLINFWRWKLLLAKNTDSHHDPLNYWTIKKDNKKVSWVKTLLLFSIFSRSSFKKSIRNKIMVDLSYYLLFVPEAEQWSELDSALLLLSAILNLFFCELGSMYGTCSKSLLEIPMCHPWPERSLRSKLSK